MSMRMKWTSFLARTTCLVLGVAVLVTFLPQEARAGKQRGTGDKDAGGAAPQRAGRAAKKSMVLILDYHSMADVVAKLRVEHEVRVCFEDLDYDMDKDRITYGQRIDQLTKTSQDRALSPRERLLLDNAQTQVRNGTPLSAPCDVDYERFSGRYEGADAGKMLGQVTKGSRYEWYQRNGTYVVRPRQKSVLDFPVTLAAKNKPLEDVILEVLKQHPPESKMSYARMGPGLGPDPLDTLRVAQLNLRQVPAHAALCRAVEAAGPDAFWTLAGFKGNRTLSLGVIRHQEDAPEAEEDKG